uniref:Uncharacterized protein n=1 Tax=Strigamia maritima TaxID=126957 RepID=T1IPW4_STRMM
MGIRGLQSYMEYHVPNGCKTVEISKLVEEYKSKNRSNRAIIVVDAMSCIRKLYTDLCWVLNGQWKELLERLEHFINKFKSLGIELVFFFDGATIEAKRHTWAKRRLQNLEDVKTIFSRYLRYGRQPPDDLFQLPAGMAMMIRFALKITFNCNVITSIKECDEEVINFAHQNKCLAILGQDSDYIVCNAAPYLSINSLDLVSMTTILYDRKAFADHIGLKLHQLPLMACLRGNDVVREELLENFHARICPRRNAASLYHLLPCLVSFIQNHPSPTNLHNARLIAKDVFGSPDKANFLMEALASYEVVNAQVVGFSGDRVTKLIRERHVKTENMPHVYSVWNFGELDSSAALEDFEIDNRLAPSALLYRPIRQRVYYVYKKSAIKNFETVKEWCVYPGHKLPAPDLVQCLPFELLSVKTKTVKEKFLFDKLNICRHAVCMRPYESMVKSHLSIDIDIDFSSYQIPPGVLLMYMSIGVGPRNFFELFCLRPALWWLPQRQLFAFLKLRYGSGMRSMKEGGNEQTHQLDSLVGKRTLAVECILKRFIWNCYREFMIGRGRRHQAADGVILFAINYNVPFLTSRVSLTFGDMCVLSVSTN